VIPTEADIGRQVTTRTPIFLRMERSSRQLISVLISRWERKAKLFGVRLKNVNNIEKGLSPPGLGKRTMCLFLEQIENMTAHLHHSNTTSTEGLGELVKVVTNFQNESQERRGETTDTGWRHKNRNVLASIKMSFDSNTVLSYLLEEQYTMLETRAGNLESILINARVDSKQATQIVASSLAFRISKRQFALLFWAAIPPGWSQQYKLVGEM